MQAKEMPRPALQIRSGEDAGEQARGGGGGIDNAVVLAAAAAAAAAAAVAIAVAVAVRKASGSRGGRAAEDRRPVARRQVARRQVARRQVARRQVARRPAAPGEAEPALPAAVPGAPAGAAAEQRSPMMPSGAAWREARGGTRVVLDTSVVINHKRRSEDMLENPDFYGPQLEYVDFRMDDLLLPDRDMTRQETRDYASANLKPFEGVSGYEMYEKALEDLRKQLVDNPLSYESARWIDRKFRWADPKGFGEEGAKIGAILDRIGAPRKEGGEGVARAAMEAITRYGREGGEEDLKYLLRQLDSAAGQDQQILAIAMKKSEERASILLANDYDFFAFPIWRGGIDRSECGPVTMVLGPADVRWIVAMPDGSARVLAKRAEAKELYSDEDYTEVLRAMQHSKAKG